MPTILAPLDLTLNELRNVVIGLLGTDPAAPVEGQLWYSSSAHVLRYRTNAGTVSIGPFGSLAALNAITSAEITDGTIVNADVSVTAAIALSKLATDPLARANHTGTQLASTISNFDTQVRTSRLDQMATPTASVSAGGQLITNLATPVSATDAATKAYADSIASGLDVKASVRVAPISNVTLASPGGTHDGIILSAGDRVLLMNQSAGAENGIWQFNGNTSAMTRTTDADTSAEVTPGMFTFVEDGTTNADKGFVLTTNAPITLGTTALTFTQFTGAASYTGTASRITVSGTVIDIAATYVGQTSITTLGTIIVGTWTGTAIAVANGGTGATTAAAARTNLNAIGRSTSAPFLIGNGSATSFALVHNLNTTDVVVELYDVNGNTIYADVKRDSVNQVTVSGFLTAPPASPNQYRVVIIG